MIEVIILSNTIAQTLAPGQSLTFDKEILHTGCCSECHRPGSGAVILNKNGIYEVFAKVDISAEADGTLQLSIFASGGELPETRMISTPSAVGDINTVCCNTAIKPCTCCGEALVVQNSGTTPVVVEPNSCLFVKRIA